MRFPSRSHWSIHTLMCDLEDGPQHLVLLLALVARVLGILHLVAEFEEGVFEVLEAVGWWFTVLGGADGWHGGNRFGGIIVCIEIL